MGGGAHMGGGGFGGGMSMGSMGAGMSTRGMSGGSSFMGSNFGSSTRSLSGLGPSSSPFSSGQSLRSMDLSNSGHNNLPSSLNRGNLSSIPGLNGGASAHDFSSFNSSRGDSLRSSNSLHSISNRNWQEGEHLSQLHNSNLHDGKFGNDKFNNGQFNHGLHDHDFNHFNNFHNRNCFVVAPFWWPVWFGPFDNCYYGYDYGSYDSPYCYYTVGYNSGDYANDDTLAYNNYHSRRWTISSRIPAPQRRQSARK